MGDAHFPGAQMWEAERASEGRLQGLALPPQGRRPQAKLTRKVNRDRPGGEEEGQDEVSHLSHQSPPLRSRPAGTVWG